VIEWNATGNDYREMEMVTFGGAKCRVAMASRVWFVMSSRLEKYSRQATGEATC